MKAIADPAPLFETTVLARAGEDLVIANPDGPDLVLTYAGADASVAADAIHARWSVDTIYLGVAGSPPGAAPDAPRYLLVIFVQPAQPGAWWVHCQLSVSESRCASPDLALAA